MHTHTSFDLIGMGNNSSGDVTAQTSVQAGHIGRSPGCVLGLLACTRFHAATSSLLLLPTLRPAEGSNYPGAHQFKRAQAFSTYTPPALHPRAKHFLWIFFLVVNKI